MAVFSRAPRDPRLVGLVDCIWWAEPEPSSDVHVEWAVPTGKAQLILSPKTSVFVGPKVAPERIERRCGEPMFGVSVVVGALSAILGIGGHEALGATVELESVWPVGSLPQRLAESADRPTLDLIEAALVDRVRPSRSDARVLAAARALSAGQSAARVGATLAVDRRRFVPVFRRETGVAPKLYERMCRCNRSIEAIRQPNAAPLAIIAAAHGYADQAHLSREVRHFAMTSPSRLHRDGSSMVNHVSADKIFKT